MTHMFISCPAHADEANVEASQAYHWDKHQHSNKQQNEPVLAIVKGQTHGLVRVDDIQ